MNEFQVGDLVKWTGGGGEAFGHVVKLKDNGWVMIQWWEVRELGDLCTYRQNFRHLELVNDECEIPL